MHKIEEYKLNATNRSQLENIIGAKRGSDVFITLAGCFPTSLIIQGAFLSLALGLDRKVSLVLNQVLTSRD